MNLQKTYIELMKKENDKHYIELAKQEILIVPMLIEIMLDNDVNQSRWAENLLEKISEASPINVYPYFGYICTAFDRSNNVTAWNCWKIIANDLFNHWEVVRENYILSLSSNMITEFLIALSVADKIINAKPDDKELVISTINNSINQGFTVCGEISESCRKVAVEAVQTFLQKTKNN